MENGFDCIVYKYDSILASHNVLNILVLKPEYIWIAR